MPLVGKFPEPNLHFYEDTTPVSSNVGDFPGYLPGTVGFNQNRDRADQYTCGPVIGTPGALNPPVPDKCCHFANTYFSDFYFRIHIEPLEVDFGVLLVTSNRSVTIFNGFLTSARINQLIDPNIEGVTYEGLDGAPITLPPLTYITLQVVADNQTGDAQFDDQLGLDIDHLDADGTTVLDSFLFNLRVWGTRGAMLVASPLRKIQHSFQFKTRVAESYMGEQRASLMDVPFETLTFKYRLDKAEAFAQLFSDRKLSGAPFGVPVWSDFRRLGVVASGLTTLTVEGEGLALDVGNEFMLWQPDGQVETFLVTGVNPAIDEVTVETATGLDYTDAFFIPLRRGYLSKGTQVDYYASGEAVAKVEYEMIDTHPVFNMTDPLTYYKAKPLVTELNWQASSVETFGTDLEKQEFDGAGRRFYPDRGFDYYQRTYTWKAFDLAAINKLRYFLHHIKGKFKAFYTLSWRNDLELVQPVAVYDASVVVKAPAVPFTADIDGRHFCFVMNDGRFIPFTVTNATTSGGETTLNIDEQATEAVALEDVRMLCALELMRSNADRFEMQFEDVHEVVCSLNLVRVTDDEV